METVAEGDGSAIICVGLTILETTQRPVVVNLETNNGEAICEFSLSFN